MCSHYNQIISWGVENRLWRTQSNKKLINLFNKKQYTEVCANSRTLLIFYGIDIHSVVSINLYLVHMKLSVLKRKVFLNEAVYMDDADQH